MGYGDMGQVPKQRVSLGEEQRERYVRNPYLVQNEVNQQVHQIDITRRRTTPVKRMPREEERVRHTQASRRSQQVRPQQTRSQQMRTQQVRPQQTRSQQMRTQQVRPQQTRIQMARPQQTRAQQIRQQQIRRRKKTIRNILTAVILIALISVGVLAYKALYKLDNIETAVPVEHEKEPIIKSNLLSDKIQGISKEKFITHPEWEEKFLTVSEYARPGDPIGKVTNIFVHYTANPGTSAAQNRSYFEQLKDTKERGASAHFIIGYNGEIIQCVPLDEIAYAVQTRNEDSISVECCFKAADGSFTQETYDSLIKLLSWLLDVYELDSEDLLRHYDCGGKKCPIYYVENEDAWKILKNDVKDYSR